jgi:hypothetical protein
VTGIPCLWQSQHYDLGMAHLLALVQAATHAPLSVLAYPATAAFAMASVTAAIFLVVRVSLRLRTGGAASAALLFALVPHPLYWGHHNGFLQQTCALAVLMLGIVLLTRCVRPGRLRAGDAVLVSVPFVFLLIVYLPLLPALGLAAAVVVAQRLGVARKRRRLGALVRFAAVVAALFLTFGLRDLVGVVWRLHNFMTDPVGGHVPYGWLEFAQFGMGVRVAAPGWSTIETAGTWLNRMLAPLYLALALYGLALALRRGRSRALAAVAILLLAALAYYGGIATDPWSHTRGHTWNVFKLCQWCLPFLVILGTLGARALGRFLRPPARIVAGGLALLVPLSLAPAHGVWSERLGLTMREILPDAAPLRSLPGLVDRLRALPPGTLLVVGRPVNANRWLSAYTGLMAYPRAILGDWADSASTSNHPLYGEVLLEQALARRDDPRIVPLVAGYVPFDGEGTDPLGMGYARLRQPTGLLILHVVNPAGLRSDASSGAPSFTMGDGRTKLVVLSPQALAAQLELDLRPYPGKPGTRLLTFLAGGDYSHRSVRLAAAEKPVAETRLSGQTVLRIPLSLPRGLATVVLVVDEGRGELDAREPVTVVGLRLSEAAPATPAATVH